MTLGFRVNRKHFLWQPLDKIEKGVMLGFSLLLITTVALGGFFGTFLSVALDITGGADAYPDGTAVEIMGASGTLMVDVAPVQGLGVTINSFAGSSIDASFHDVSPGDSGALQMDISAAATNPAALYLGPPPASEWAGVDISYDASAMVCGDTIAPGAGEQVKLYFDFLTIDPGQHLTPTIPWLLAFTEGVPGCP